MAPPPSAHTVSAGTIVLSQNQVQSLSLYWGSCLCLDTDPGGCQGLSNPATLLLGSNFLSIPQATPLIYLTTSNYLLVWIHPIKICQLTLPKVSPQNVPSFTEMVPQPLHTPMLVFKVSSNFAFVFSSLLFLNPTLQPKGNWLFSDQASIDYWLSNFSATTPPITEKRSTNNLEKVPDCVRLSPTGILRTRDWICNICISRTYIVLRM